MVDIGTKIANVITTGVLFLFGSYLYRIAKQTAKYHMVKFYFILIGKYKPFMWMWKNDKLNSIIYLIIPVIFTVGFFLLSQVYEGIFKLRYDVQIILGSALWVLMLKKEKIQHDLICALYEIIRELKERLSKYE